MNEQDASNLLELITKGEIVFGLSIIFSLVLLVLIKETTK